MHELNKMGKKFLHAPHMSMSVYRECRGKSHLITIAFCPSSEFISAVFNLLYGTQAWLNMRSYESVVFLAENLSLLSDSWTVFNISCCSEKT